MRVVTEKAYYHKINNRDEDYREREYHKNHQKPDATIVSEKLDDIQKYVKEKYFIFSRYDQGVYLDRQGWFSITPEPISTYMASFAKNLKKGIVVDCCSGVGGNSLQFADLPNISKCYMIDLDENRI